MKFVCLDGSTISVNVNAKDYIRHKSRSEFQAKVKTVLRELYKNYDILEDFPIPNSGNLSLDFFVPMLKLAIEVDGIQHTKFVPMFHRSRQDFVTQTKNDGRKQEWCEMNGIRLIRVPHTTTDIKQMLSG